jgi:hypothetical protein
MSSVSCIVEHNHKKQYLDITEACESELCNLPFGGRPVRAYYDGPNLSRRRFVCVQCFLGFFKVLYTAAPSPEDDQVLCCKLLFDPNGGKLTKAAHK